MKIMFFSDSDIDECSFGSQVCKPHSICTNTEGAYDCECKAGFVGNGHVRCVSKFEFLSVNQS